MLHINKVAELMDITVRTLRYYDKVGLIQPASKTEGGHRLYAVDELKRLQQVQFLKKGGFSLKEIKRILDSPDWNWRQSLEKQLASVLEEQKRLTETEAVLRGLINSLSIERNNEERAIQNLLQLSAQHQEIRQQFRTAIFTENEMTLLEKVPNLADNSADTQEWLILLDQLTECMHEGVHSPRIQKIIQRMDEKRLEVFNEEEEFTNKLWDIRMSPEQSKEMGLYPIDQTVLEFIKDAHLVYEANHQKDGEEN